MSYICSNVPVAVTILLVVSVSAIFAVPPIASICSVQWTPSSAYDIFDDLINKSNYKKDVRPINASAPSDPVTGATPTNVKINFYVAHIESIDKTNGNFRVQLIFRQSWLDTRLAYENTPQYQNQCNNNRPSKLKIPDSMIGQMWVPDLFISQELDAKNHELFHPNRLVKVSPDGNLLLSQRITLTLACPQLAKIDLAKKECEMSVESYGYLQDEISLDWTDEHPVYVLNNTFVPMKYKLDKVIPLRCDTTTPKGTYSCVQGKFSFSKNTQN